jgi:hypothetical protein
MDEKLSRIRELIELKEKTDTELAALIGGGQLPEARQRKPQACSLCHAEGHTARTCPTKGAQNGQTPPYTPPSL